ncbi:hypothetical protein GCM10027053_33650 [Intrasporangium mesophilum]
MKRAIRRSASVLVVAFVASGGVVAGSALAVGNSGSGASKADAPGVTKLDIPVVDDPSTMDALGRLKYESDRPGTDGWVPRGQRKNELRKPESIKAALGISPLSLPPDPGGYPSSAYVKANQQGQQRDYWCGPATLVETLGQHPGATTGTQSWAASQLGTTTDGTTKDAMNRELNQWAGGFLYDRVDLPFTPSSTDVANFRSHLKEDINRTAGVAGVAYEVYQGPHLRGHPDNSKPIYHYFNIRGYSDSGSTTYYEDSATTVWPAVPAYSYLGTSTIVMIMGGRGYHW